MTGVGSNNRRHTSRPHGNFEGPRDFSDNTVGGVAYIHLEGTDHIAEAPKTGLLNEANGDGCSIILSDDACEPLMVGEPCFLRIDCEHRGRAVIRWRRPFGVNASKLGFQFID